MIQAAVWRISRFGLAAAAITHGYQRAALRRRESRSPSCTRACWICRGLERSAKYASRSESPRERPNQVLYQNRKGNSTRASANSAIRRYARRPGRLCGRGLLIIEVWMEVAFRNVSRGLTEDRFPDFDVAALLVYFFETELREDFEDVVPGEGLKLWHGQAVRVRRRRAPTGLRPDQAPQDPRAEGEG